MTLSAKTLASPIALGKEETIEIGTNLTATERLSTGEFSKNVNTTRRSPNTSVDMYNLETWKKGDTEPKGTHAKNSPAWKRYRRDIDSAPGNNDYDGNTIYINNFKPIGEQLAKLKK